MRYPKRYIFVIVFIASFFMPSGILSQEATTAETDVLAEESSLPSSSRFTEPVLPEGAKVSEQILGLQGLANVGRVAPGIFRGGQPKPEGYATLKKMGFKTVINLRSMHDEKAKVEAAGMRYIEIPLTVLEDIKPEIVNKVIQALTNPENQPVFIHCKQGQDRTGAIIAIYRIEIDGWPLEEAEAEMQSFGFNNLWFKLKKAVRRYVIMKEKQAEEEPIPQQ